ncbi:MAG TPA: 3-oxoacyl-ACP reductase family protein [Candidatus Methylomirabilis sp.]|jgi:3-oxoacyl-[acyl-carrier protein] reductase
MAERPGRVEGRVALVTGASRGFGRATALHLAREGAAVAVNYREDAAAAQAVLREVQGAGGHAMVVQADVSVKAEVERMVAQVVGRFGRVDILVNNAGITSRSPLEDLEEAEWDRTLAVNLKGVYLCSRAVLERMKAQGGGRIVNLSSGFGRFGRPGAGLAYAASKAGIIGFTRTMAKNYGPYGIAVNCVAPGPILTDMAKGLAPEAVEAMLAGIALPRQGTADDVAAAVLFLAGDEAGWITGVILDVNGGLTIA